jgi:hypothetical protein
MRIIHKLEYVLLPRMTADKEKELKNWDLWGPLIFCLILCMYDTDVIHVDRYRSAALLRRIKASFL